MKAIMYHYVRTTNGKYPKFRYLHVDDFKAQLDWFQREDRLLTREEFTGIIQGSLPVPKDGVVLTFDDGFSDHYHYVFPELQKRNVFGIFYVPTLPYTQNPSLLDVHKIHHLTGKVSSETLLEQLESILKTEMVVREHVNAFKEKTYRHHSDSEPTKIFKRLFNYFIHKSARSLLLDRLLEQNLIALDAKQFYLTPTQLKTMHDGGMIIGSHSMTHPVFSTLSYTQQEQEIQTSFSLLKKMIGGEFLLKTFCYPYGGFHSFTSETEDILQKHQVCCSFNVESRSITEQDIKQRPQALPRYDCNLFPYGKAQ